MSSKKLIHKFSKSIIGVVAVVLVWRGIWIFLDNVDQYVFGGSRMWTAILGIIAGLILLYILDDDLKEFERL